MLSRRKARILAFQALFQWEFNKASLDQLNEFQWSSKAENLSDEDLLFSRLLVAGTLEELDQIDSLIAKQSTNWELKRVNKVDLAILRISVYSLLYQKDIPANITIDEAIEIAREYGTDESFRFVNGVLDGIRKQLI
jgi:N utilization substance protein B